jgi:hypothetical protein
MKKKYDNTKYIQKLREKSLSYGVSASQVQKYGFKTVLEVYNNYDKKCFVCGTEEYLQLHHKDCSGKTDNPNNSIDNFQLICRSCHGRLHSREYWDKKIQENGGYLWKGKEKAREKAYKDLHRKEIIEKQKIFRDKNRDRMNTRARELYQLKKERKDE